MRIKLSHNDFFKISSYIVMKNCLLCDDGVLIDVTLAGIKYLKKNGIKYQYQNLFFKELFFNSFFIIGFGLFIISMIINNDRISNISFNGNFIINDDIYYYLEDNLKHLGPFSFLDCSLEEINEYLRGKYIGYEWISVTKKGNELVVNINEVPYNNTSEEKIIGNIVSNKYGTIKDYKVYSGTVNIKRGQYVCPGDVLVLGNNNMARAIIYAVTFEEITIDVKKKIADDSLTGKVDNYEVIEFFNQRLSFHQDEKFERSIINKKCIIDLGIIKYYDIQEIEKCDIITIYDKSQALDYAKTLISSEFELKKCYEEESILALELVSITENEESYSFKFYVKKYENIGAFNKE